MITINIPENTTICAEHLILDYNGTLAVDGILIPGVKEKLNALSEKINIYVITADTYGKAQESLKEIRCRCIVLKGNDEPLRKHEFISGLGFKTVIAVGNGANDALMLKNAALGIIVTQKEGASVKSLINADIICTHIIDALDLLSNPLRIAATLRI